MATVDVKEPSDNEEFDVPTTQDNVTAPSEAPVHAAEPQAETPSPAPVSPAAATVKSSKMSKLPVKNDRNTWRVVAEAVLVIAVIVLGVWCWNLSSENNNLNKQVAALNANPQALVQKQTESLISQVGSLMTLPTNETPTIAEVSNAAQARQQSAFFNNAQNGDKVLMYVKAGEAILYRPSTNKIILVAPLTFTNNGTGTSSSSTSGH